MRDLACENQFLLEPLQSFRITRQLGPDYLHSQQPVQLDIAGLKDRTHSALTQRLQDLVAPGQQGPRKHVEFGGFAVRNASSPIDGLSQAGERCVLDRDGAIADRASQAALRVAVTAFRTLDSW